MSKELDLIKSDKYLNDFFIRNNLSDTYLENNKNKLLRIYKSRSLCNGCRGLYMCKQSTNGQRLDLRYDGVLIDEIENCPYALPNIRKENFIKSYSYCDIPTNLIDINLDNIKPTSDQEELYVRLRKIVEGNNKGLYIYGNNGSGKTYLCIALANSLVLKKQKVAFVKVTNFIKDMKSYIADRSALFDINMNTLQKCNYLILDDIGCEAVSEFVRDDILFTILDYRLENKLTTIFTSNRDKANLEEHYTYDRKNNSDAINARRLMVRIDNLADDYVLSGKDMRREY